MKFWSTIKGGVHERWGARCRLCRNQDIRRHIAGKTHRAHLTSWRSTWTRHWRACSPWKRRC